MKSKSVRQIYTVPRVADILGVTKQAVYYWIKKGWITEPGRNYKSQRVFTKEDLNKIIKWKNSIKKP